MLVIEVVIISLWCLSPCVVGAAVWVALRNNRMNESIGEPSGGRRARRRTSTTASHAIRRAS